MEPVAARIAFLQHSASDVPGLLGALADVLGLDVSVHRPDHGPDALPRPGSFDLLVVMGSIESVYNSAVPWIEPERHVVARAVDNEVPVLGVCFGAQLLAQVLGGTVGPAASLELGWTTVQTADPERIGAGPWLNWHEDAFTCPPGAELLATSDIAPQAYIQGIHTGVQFHPEVTADVVEAWIHEARDTDGIDDAQANALRSGFDPQGRGADRGCRALFFGFLNRAGLLA
jgi:GMP synthase-like glutamine amidotransferase